MQISSKNVVLVCAIAHILSPRPALADPRAVVRIQSHGATGVVFFTNSNYTDVMTCAHIFDRYKNGKSPSRTRFRIHMVLSEGDRFPGRSGIRLVKYDRRLDLAILRIPRGPAPYVMKIAEPGYRCRHAHSFGYDTLLGAEKAGPQAFTAMIRGGTGNWTFTQQGTIPGRSGGALVCTQTGLLVGLCSGNNPQGGRYVSLRAIRQFVSGGGRGGLDTRPV